MKVKNEKKKTLSWILPDIKKEAIRNDLSGRMNHVLILQPAPEKMHRKMEQGFVCALSAGYQGQSKERI